MCKNTVDFATKYFCMLECCKVQFMNYLSLTLLLCRNTRLVIREGKIRIGGRGRQRRRTGSSLRLGRASLVVASVKQASGLAFVLRIGHWFGARRLVRNGAGRMFGMIQTTRRTSQLQQSGA